MAAKGTPIAAALGNNDSRNFVLRREGGHVHGRRGADNRLYRTVANRRRVERRRFRAWAGMAERMMHAAGITPAARNGGFREHGSSGSPRSPGGWRGAIRSGRQGTRGLL